MRALLLSRGETHSSSEETGEAGRGCFTGFTSPHHTLEPMASHHNSGHASRSAAIRQCAPATGAPPVKHPQSKPHVHTYTHTYAQVQAAEGDAGRLKQHFDGVAGLARG